MWGDRLVEYVPMTREELEGKIKEIVVSSLDLEDLTVADIATDVPLFGEGLGLDSIDALELIVMMEKQYGIKLKDPKEGKEIFKSVATMAEYIAQHRTR